MQGRIGIRREDKDPREKRAPLTPAQVGQLVRTGIVVDVETAQNRAFRDDEYAQVGANVSEDLSRCNLVLGAKEIPNERIAPDQNYLFFSHTIKGQLYNMPMLQRILDVRATLMDYEKVVDAQGRRLIFFGRFAGRAGMVRSLWALGQRLRWEGLVTPFESIGRAYTYASLDEAKAAVTAVGQEIQRRGLPAGVTPLVCGFAGYGNVSKGAQEIFDLLPVETIAPEELEARVGRGGLSNKSVYKVVFKEEHCVEPVAPGKPFVLADYYQRPEGYRGRFERNLPFLTLLINANYWEPQYPHLVTLAALRELFAQEARLRVIGDISCDVNGAIECTVETTSFERPTYVFDPATEKIRYGCEGKGPIVLSIDRLPNEFAREATDAFGSGLMPFLPALARLDYKLPFEKLVLPEPFQGAVIAHRGALTPAFTYLETALARA